LGWLWSRPQLSVIQHPIVSSFTRARMRVKSCPLSGALRVTVGGNAPSCGSRIGLSRPGRLCCPAAATT
jgi:hypothetical protein